MCQLLPWHQYETILRFYLTKLRYEVDFQKQLVRTVVAILDAFHFDLSRAQIYAVQHKGENIEMGHVELMQVEVNDKKDVSVGSIPYPSGSVMTVPINKNDKESGETGILDSVEDNTNKTIEEAGPEELVDRLEGLLDLEDVVCKVEEKECDATHEMASAPVPAVTRNTVLNMSVATHVVQTITTGLLPQIHHVMAQLTQEELSHKVNKKQTTLDKEDEGILRVPIALAAVKLLQHLPSHMLDHNLPG
jgi:U3 small nucleolar RNA-associated protein 20